MGRMLTGFTVHKNNSKATSISCFDFSTFYTNIPHDKLLKVLYGQTEFCFNGRDKSEINRSEIKGQK